MPSSGVSPNASKEAVAVATAASTPSNDTDHDQEFAMDEVDRQHKSTHADADNMRRMGRNQELVRHFRMLSMLSFVALATAAWELAMFAITPSLIDGGRPNLIWSSLWAFLGFGPIYFSMAEMASMAPIAGAQYHWVSEFAPESCQKILSYLSGWTSTLAWQAGNAWGTFLVGTLIQSIITVNDINYPAPEWQGSLLIIGFIIVAVCANIFGAKALPYWQNILFALHILALAGFIIPVWINAPKVESQLVWGTFENTGGWGSLSLAIFIGQMPGLAAQTGIDTAVHMAEEVRDAAKSVPRVMIYVWAINYVLILITVVTLSYHIPDIPAALADATEYPAIYVMKQSMSLAWVNVLLAVILVIMFFSSLSYLAAVTRDLFAFARDNGLPFSGWIGKVDKNRSVPANACILTGVFSACLSLIYIGSPVAFYALTSLSTVAVLQCYCLSIGCLLWRRIFYPETLPYARFSLGRWGIAVNASAVLFSLWSFFWCFWPQEYPVTAAGFNWSSPIFIAVLAIAMLYYVAGGRHKYHGPVTLVEGRKTRVS